MTNTAAVLTQVGTIALEQRSVPSPSPGEALVRVELVTICGSDVHYYEHGRIADFVVDGPLVLGHESSGVVVQVGDGVPAGLIDTRVALEPGIFCGRCRACRTGHYNLCVTMAFHATPPYDGSLQQYVVLPVHLLHPLPDDMSFEQGALVEPLAVAVMACRGARLDAGQRVLVTGAGAVGVLCAQAALAFGAAEVVLTDVNPARLAHARALGVAQTCLTTDLPGREADVLLECSGAASALWSGILALRPGGTAVAIGFGPDEQVAVPLSWMQVHEITLTATFRYANAHATAVGLVRDGHVRLDGLVGGTFPLADTEQALRLTRGRPDVLRAAVMPQQ